MSQTSSYYHKRDLLILTGAAVAAFLVFKANFVIGFPAAQFSGCLSQDVFLVSKNEREVVRGGIYAVTLDRDLKTVKRGAKLMKIVAATGGDTVRIEDDGIWVNEKTFLPVALQGVAMRSNLDLAALRKTITVPPHHLFLVGNTDKSYDSRFWGTIDEKNIIGRAITLW